MDIDPLIITVFGSPPAAIDFSKDQRFGNDVSVVVLLVIAALGVSLRLAARMVRKSGLKADDYAIIIALVFGFGTGGLSIAGGNFGAGKHIWAIEMKKFITMMKILYGYTYIYAAAVAMTKISILLFYRRIFGFEGIVWRSCLVTGAILAASYPLVIWITMANCCKPVSLFWNRFIGASGTCIDINTFFLALGIINMAIDIIVLVIPIPKILALNMASRKKLGVCGIFLLGSFVCVASLVRIIALAEFMKAVDVTWHMGSVFIWSSVEPSIGIFSACLPSLRPLWLHFRTKISSYYDSQSDSRSRNAPESNVKTFGQTSRSWGFKRIKLTKEDDEISLTSVAVGGPAENGLDKNGIFVHNNLEQNSTLRAN